MARAMKDSGIAWIGEIPEEWEVCPLKNVIQWKSEKNHEDSTVLSLYRDYGVIPKDSRDDNHNVTSLDTSGYKYVQPGDLVINKMKAWQGSIAVSDFEGIVSPAYHVCAITNPRINKRYLHHLLRNPAYLPEYLRLSTGMRVGQWDLGFDDFKNIPIVVPSLTDQERITHYIDQECTRIDAVIEQTRASIKEYKKLKQAVITQAVTKGIRPNRPLKDSAVKWIGRIPEEWSLTPFRHVLHERNEKNSPVISTERLSLSIDVGVTLYSEKTTNLDRFKDDFEQYKLAHVGDLVMNSMNMIVGATGVSEYYGCVSPAYYTFYDDTPDHITTKFCEYVFRSKTMLRVLYSLGKGIYAIVRGDDRVNTCRLKVSREDLRSIIMPMPKVDEQREIIGYLDKKTKEIDALITQKEKMIDEIERYKRAIVYEYVTGKKEVMLNV